MSRATLPPYQRASTEQRFACGSGSRARRKYNIPDGAFVVGHVGRLAPEKNLPFLTRAVCGFLRSRPEACFLLVGTGPSLEEIQRIARRQEVANRLVHPPGVLKGQDLVDAYHAMNVFAFASHSETQGMVLAEAMAAGVPVVAVDAPGVREVVRDSFNGRLLAKDDHQEFADAISWCAERSPTEQDALVKAVRRTADLFAMPKCTERLLAVYRQVSTGTKRSQQRDDSDWAALLRLLEEEWNILTGVAAAVSDSLFRAGSDAKVGRVID